jgi:outer membrane protein TolC
MKFFTCVLLLALSTRCFSQQPDTLTIFECYGYAVKNYPVIRQKEYIEDAHMNKVRNINTSWYPSLAFGGQTSYQSDVTEISVPGMNLPSQPHDQYKVYLELNQSIYDGGTSRASRKLESNSCEIDLQQIEVELNTLKQRITGVYFSVLLLDKQLELLNLALNELNEKLIVIESGIKNGILMPSDRSVLQAEILKLRQRIFDAQLSRESELTSLCELTGLQLDTGVYLKLPQAGPVYESTGLRPEYEMFELQKKQMDINSKSLATFNRPRLFAFSQAGYGKPGLNMLNDEFDTYYLIGLGFSWNFFDWGETKRKEKILGSQKDIINTKIEIFEKNLNIQLENEMANIEKYEKSAEIDRQIVKLRSEIKESSFSQLQNGIITFTDFLTEMNAEVQAKLELETHIILLQQSLFNYLTLKGEI